MKYKLFIFVLIAVMLVTVTGCGKGTSIQVDTPVPNPQTGTPTPNDQIKVPGFNIQFNAPGPNPLVNKTDAHSRVSGILLGIWHGIISPITLVVSFINPNIQMYEVHNDGSPYNLGFLLGVVILFIILGVIAGSRR